MRFSDSLKSVRKVRNHPKGKEAKATIRRHVLDAIGDDAVVFDAFAGAGQMHHAVWHRAAGYVGCDKEWTRDNRLAYVADNRRVLRAIDLAPCTVFDLDAYGSPWEQAIIIADRRPVKSGECIGMILTEGSGLTMKQGGLPLAICELTGLRRRMSGLSRWQDDVIDRAISGLAKRMRCVVERRWQAERKAGAAMRYIGLVLRGVE